MMFLFNFLSPFVAQQQSFPGHLFDRRGQLIQGGGP